MVFFCCEGCNETLKKNQVENHLRRASCGHYPVSCVDCSQVFHGVDYQAHTSCISEAEKYEKSLYKGPKAGGGGGKGKKRSPQDEWMDMISLAAAEGGSVVGLSPSLRGQLPRMAQLGNVPRNEKKFKNFLSNSLRINRVTEQEELWKFLTGKIDAAKAITNEAEEKKKKERKGEEEQMEEKEEENDAATTALKEPDKEGQETISTPTETLDGTKKSKKGKKKKKETGEEGEAAVEDEPATPRHSKKQKNETITLAVEEEKGGDQRSAAAVGEAEASFSWAKTIKKLIKKADGRKMDRQTLQKGALALASKSSNHGKKALKRQFKEILGGGVTGVQVDGDVVMLIK